MHTEGTPVVNTLTELSSVEKAVLGAIFHKHAGQPFFDHDDNSRVCTGGS